MACDLCGLICTTFKLTWDCFHSYMKKYYKSSIRFASNNSEQWKFTWNHFFDLIFRRIRNENKSWKCQCFDQCAIKTPTVGSEIQPVCVVKVLLTFELCRLFIYSLASNSAQKKFAKWKFNQKPKKCVTFRDGKICSSKPLRDKLCALHIPLWWKCIFQIIHEIAPRRWNNRLASLL